MGHYQRPEKISDKIGTKHQKKIKKFSDGFKEKFNFFFKVRKSGLIDFWGEKVEVEFNVNGPCGRECFRMFEDGKFSKGKQKIETRHTNILKMVIEGKKGWGLWVNQWSDWISEGSFTKYEILNEFEIRNIIIPDSFRDDFENQIWKKRFKYLQGI